MFPTYQVRLSGLGSTLRVGYSIPVPDFYLVLHDLKCRKTLLWINLNHIIISITQAHVPDVPGAAVRAGPAGGVHGHAGFRAGRRQALPLLVPLVQLGGGGQGRPAHARPHPRAPGLARQGRAVDEADRLLR